MKRLCVLGLILAATGGLWWNREKALFLFYSHVWMRPKKISFLEYDTDRINLLYTKSNYFSKRIESIARALSHNLASAESDVGTSLNRKMKVYLYNTWEEKGNDLNDLRVAAADPQSGSMHFIINEMIDGTTERLEYELLLRQRYGPPGRPEWGTYAAIGLSGFWNQKSLKQWADFLLSRNLTPKFPEYLDPSMTISEYLLYPWNGMFSKFVRERYGWEAFVKLFKQGQPPEGYDEQWNQYLNGLSSDSPHAYVFKPEFQKGISYAYTNSYDAGYATLKSARSLDELREVGVKWIAALPYGFVRSADSTEIGLAGHSIIGESDESMMAVAQEAKARGMKIMMKPQLWIHHDSWPGDIDFQSEDLWEKWFQSYENWIVHYAILSELIHADLFCVGTELVQSTLNKPEKWRKIIARVREIYHGPIVYAANYGKEFERITFWDSLDYMGLDNYYPVRMSAKDGPRQMRIAFQEQKEKLGSLAARHRKPLLFTEIGYTANETAGMNGQDSGSGHYNEELQAECYRIALETYWDEPWFYGMYWWKWFSDPDERGIQADPHSPHGRATETVLQQWYNRQDRILH